MNDSDDAKTVSIARMVRGDGSDPVEDLEPDPVVDTSVPGCLNVSLMATFASVACFPVSILTCMGCFTMQERTHGAVLYFGKYVGSVQNPGIHFLPPIGRELRQIKTSTRTMNLKGLKVVDSRGNPVMVSAVVTFEPTSAKKARIDVVDPWPNSSWTSVYEMQPTQTQESTYLQLQAEAVLKQVTSQFPYEAPPGEPSLQTEGGTISTQLITTLQRRVNVTGARVLSFDLVDLSYAPEIAQAMLVRQQAAALVEARKLIVQAAVDMTTSAVTSLEQRMGGEPLPDVVRNRICTNLLTVVCSHEAVTPTIGVGGESG